MALTNSQYDAIMRGYEHRRDENRSLLVSRQKKIYSEIPGYEELTDSVSSLSVDAAKLLLSGNGDALALLHDSLEEISRKQKKLLADYGYPEDYLEPVCTCPECQDTGYVTGTDGRKEKCRCFRLQEVSILYDQSNIREIISRENFSTLSYDHYHGDDLARFKTAVTASHNFIQNFKEDYHNLFFYGTVGTGKSFLSGCVAKELIESGHSVIYFSTTGLFDLLSKNSFDYKNREELRETYADLYQCDLLIIDDLGTELTNQFVTSQLFALLNERHMGKKATIISTNLSLEELRNRYSDRIFSRITSHYEICKLTGQDIRMYRKRLMNRK